MSHIPYIRWLLLEAADELAPARLAKAPHPVVPVAIASNRIRDALHLLALEGGPVPEPTRPLPDVGPSSDRRGWP